MTLIWLMWSLVTSPRTGTLRTQTSPSNRSLKRGIPHFKCWTWQTWLAPALRNTSLAQRCSWYPAGRHSEQDCTAALGQHQTKKSWFSSTLLLVYLLWTCIWQTIGVNDILARLACKYVATVGNIQHSNGQATCYTGHATQSVPCWDWQDISMAPCKACDHGCRWWSQACLQKPPTLLWIGSRNWRHDPCHLLLGVLLVRRHWGVWDEFFLVQWLHRTMVVIHIP